MPYSNYLASGGEDCTIKIWKMDETAAERILTQPQSVLYGHSKWVLQMSFNKSAQSILATSSLDTTLKVWDIEQGKPIYTIGATKTEYC
jgi:WD40 repeat protein